MMFLVAEKNVEKLYTDDNICVEKFDFKDFKDETLSFRVINGCEKIIKTYKEDKIFDSDKAFRDLWEESSNILVDNRNLVFVLYSKEGCEPGKRKPISFAFFSPNEETNDWILKFGLSRYESDSKYYTLLMDSSFKYLNSQNIEKVNFSVPQNNKNMLKAIDTIFKSALLQRVSNENKRNVDYTFDLKAI